MPFSGGYSPSPERYGGGEGNSKEPLLQRVFESIAAQRGSAYDQTLSTPVGVENMAYARAITFDGYGCNTRLANNFLPAKMSATLSRWEAIFNVPPQPGDTEPTRRARVAAAFALVGQANSHQPVADAVIAALGPLFVSFVYQSPAVGGTALSYWGGPGGIVSTTIPWASTVDHVDIQVQAPVGYKNPSGTINGAFYSRIGAMVSVLDAMLPSWITYDWFLTSSHGGIGFYLDEQNLDVEAFDV
jgi:hypothetical protein